MTVESDEEKVAFHKIQAPQPHDTEPTFGGHDDRTANIPEPHVSVSVLDPRLTEMVDRASIQSVEQGGSTTTTATLSTGDPVAKKHFSSTSNDNVLVVIISNRRDGIIPTIASIIKTASKPVDVVLIGEHVINNEVGRHFGKRINEFISLSVQDITDDLVGQNIQPIWTWDDWHVSVDNPQWRNENTIVRVATNVSKRCIDPCRNLFVSHPSVSLFLSLFFCTNSTLDHGTTLKRTLTS